METTPDMPGHPTRLARVRGWLGARRWPLLLFTIAFAIRAIYLFAYSRSPYFQGYVADALFHRDWANRILEGDLFGTRLPGVFYKAPLYPYFIASIDALTGRSGFLLMLVQGVLSSWTCVLLFQVGRPRFGVRAAFLGGLIYALYFPAIYFSAELELPTLALFLTLLPLRWLDGGSRPRTVAAAALAFGLSLLALPTNLLLLPWFVLWLARRPGGGKAARRPILIFVGITAATVAPCTLRNWIVGGHPTLISANGGLNFYIGNNPAYDRTVSLQPGYAFEDFYDEPRRLADASTFEARDRYWYRKAFAFIARHPLQEAALLGKKVVLYLADYEIYRNTDTNHAKAISIYRRVPFVPASVILAAGLLGVALHRKRGRGLGGFGFWLASPCVIFFVTDRYRLPSMAVWSVFAGAALESLGQALRARALRPAALGLAAAGLLVGVSTRNLFVVENPAYRPHLNLGFIHESRAAYDLALAEYQAALDRLRQAAPADPRTEAELYCRMGNVWMLKNDRAAAEHAFTQALARDPRSAPAHAYLGTLFDKQGRHAEADGSFARAVALNPWDGITRHNYGLALLHAGRTDEAIVQFRRAIALVPGFAAAYSDLAYAYASRGDAAAMEAAAQSALRYDPTLSAARYNLASVYLNLRRTDEAVAQYRAIIAFSPRASANAHNQLGVLAAERGDLKTAMAHWQQALEVEPENPDARANLARARLMTR